MTSALEERDHTPIKFSDRAHAGRFEGRGIVVMDQRHQVQNEKMLQSAQGFLFSQQTSFPFGFERLVECPLLVPSDYYHGVQAADSIARAVARVFRYRVTGDYKDERFEDQLGQRLDNLAYRTNPGWSSVFIRGQRRTPTPPPSQQLRLLNGEGT